MSRTDWVKERRLIALVVLLAAVAAAGGVRSRKAWAFNPQPEPPGRWGMFGLVEGQTARVTVVNTSADPHGYPPGPCRVSLAFVDSEGIVLKEARLTLRPGQATSLDYGFQAPPDPDRATRQDLRARIAISDLVDPGDRVSRLYPPGPCVPAVEVFETATGRTAFLVAEARMGAGPHLVAPPEPDSAPR
jgi:hypothetical protein